MAAAPSSTVNAIVWEYESDIQGLFSPYDENTSNYIEEQYSKVPRNEQFCLGTPNHLLADYDIDLTSMVQCNKRRGKSRKIQRQLHDIRTSTIGSGVCWQWMTDKGWVNYDTEAMEAIEKCFTQGIAECDLATLRFALPNVVYIDKGYQKNKCSGFVRPVQRKSAAYKTDGPLPMKKGGQKRKKLSSASDLQKGHVLSQFCSICNNVPEDEECPICLSNLKEEQQTSSSNSSAEDVFELKICKHKFHESCLEALYKQTHHANNCLKCPICKQIHGILCGNQPPGRMSHRIDMSQSVDGYEGDGIIVITYDIPSGKQGSNHPNPGRRYHATGFPRTAYLPANKKGKMVLKLLEIAFERKLIFTVGSSSTTGQENCVTWTNIHHKTSPYDTGSGHGYPDPSYLDNVIEELKENGVTEDDIS